MELHYVLSEDILRFLQFLFQGHQVYLLDFMFSPMQVALGYL